LSAIPSLEEKRDRIILKGEIGSPINPKPGCRFAPRCSFARDICSERDIPLTEVGEGHFVACARREII
jgi:peptide/nickel transport system ATP-binding protein